MEALDASGDREKALEEAMQLQTLFPGVAQVHMAAAQQLVRAGKYEQAGAAFEEVLKLSPGQKEAELGLADCLQKSGRYQESLQHYLAAGPAPPARLGQARSLIAMKQLEEARKVLESTLPEYPSNLTLRLELSRLYARLGQAGSGGRTGEDHRRDSVRNRSMRRTLLMLPILLGLGIDARTGDL